MPKVDPKLHTCGPRVAEELVSTVEQTVVWQVYTQSSLFRQLTLQGLRAYKSVQGDQGWGNTSENHLGERVDGRTKRRIMELYKGYFYAAQALKDYLPRHESGVGEDWFPYMVLRNLVNGGSMPLWMQDLLYRNGGVPPECFTNSDVLSPDEIYKNRADRGDPEKISMPEWGI